METRDKFVMSVAFSPDNKYVASGGLDGLVNIFDVKVSCARMFATQPLSERRGHITQRLDEKWLERVCQTAEIVVQNDMPFCGCCVVGGQDSQELMPRLTPVWLLCGCDSPCLIPLSYVAS